MGRVGCFVVGGDYGRPTSLPIGVKFPQGLPPSTAGNLSAQFGVAVPPDAAVTTVLAVHPTQLYETAIMLAVFDRFGLERMTYADGALRLGVLYDLLGRFHHEDRRESTIAEFQRRYQVDLAQADRVEALALALYRQLQPEPGPEHEHDAQFLTWAARLHELGISVAHSAHHKHGAYILTYADMPGFSKTDQSRLALLVLGHRGKLDKVAVLTGIDANWHLLFCLRLAVLFHRSRSEYELPRLQVSSTETGFVLDVASAWLKDNPLTAAAIDDECALWARVGIPLTLKESRDPRARVVARAG